MRPQSFAPRRSSIQILLNLLRFSQQKWDVLVRRVDELCHRGDDLFEFVGEFLVLLVLPRFAEFHKVALNGSDLRLHFSIEALQIKRKSAQFFGVDNGF